MITWKNEGVVVVGAVVVDKYRGTAPWHVWRGSIFSAVIPGYLAVDGQSPMATVSDWCPPVFARSRLYGRYAVRSRNRRLISEMG